MRSIVSIFVSIFALVSVVGCEHDHGTCGANEPGNLTLIIKLQHHEHQIVNLKHYRDTVYVKCNSLNFPGKDPLLYNGIYIGDYPSESVRIPNLNCGDYFIYATGFESIHSQRVSGGVPFSTTQKSGEVTITIPVTE